jgi:alcohol dehydrogenase class IV
VAEDFTWRDGERLVRFGEGVAAAAPELLAAEGFSAYALLTTDRAAASAPALPERAQRVVHVPSGRVDEISAALLAEVPEGAVVALGGGRVVDAAKAVAGTRRGRCAAVPTTLSGAEMTPFHRLPAGVDGARMLRPALVIADPELMASQPPTQLAASTMNALAHAMEALYTPLANPVTELAALRATALLAAGIRADRPVRDRLALGAVLAGYASGAAGIAVHHALCQTIVRTAGAPHAETNAVMLPHSAHLMAGRAPEALGRLATALGTESGDPEAVEPALAGLAARSGRTRLKTLGVAEDALPAIASAATAHPALANTPARPGEEELLAVLRRAY